MDWVGVATPGLPTDLTAYDSLATKLGAWPGGATFYSAWSYGKPFPADACDVLTFHGAVPTLTWEPWDPTAGVTQPAYTLAAISSGQFDAYITSWAQAIAAWGKPLRIRFAHEMNGNWYPWCEGVNGNQPGDYVKAWRHVRALFAAVPNVTWVWCPGIERSYTGMFPGSSAVDEVALDGYNDGLPWRSFESLFSADLDHFARLTSKPVSIGETGCTPTGGDKAAWITAMWQFLAARPQVRGLVWFDFPKRYDWRLETSPAVLAAFKAGLPAPLV